VILDEHAIAVLSRAGSHSTPFLGGDQPDEVDGENPDDRNIGGWPQGQCTITCQCRPDRTGGGIHPPERLCG
jgi:hypothetical protein